jgi:hypothetical protein
MHIQRSIHRQLGLTFAELRNFGEWTFGNSRTSSGLTRYNCVMPGMQLAEHVRPRPQEDGAAQPVRQGLVTSPFGSEPQQGWDPGCSPQVPQEETSPPDKMGPPQGSERECPAGDEEGIDDIWSGQPMKSSEGCAAENTFQSCALIHTVFSVPAPWELL